MPQKCNRTPLLPIVAALAFLILGVLICLGATIDVGSGAPSDGLSQRFQNAFFRNGFAYLVSLPPAGNVTRFGATGLIQEFNSANQPAGSSTTGTANAGPRLAMIKSNMSTALPTDGSVDVAQVLANMYSYYTTIGVNTAGYPTTDTINCPTVTKIACEYQFFNKNYVLFSYDSTTFNGDNFAVRDPFYTKWKTLGGINGLGPATDIERNITVGGGAATVQLYVNGEIFNNTSGTLNGRVFVVTSPIYQAYVKTGDYSGFLGLPTSDDMVLSGANHRQTFQGGNLDYTVGSGVDPAVKLPVDSLSLLPYATSAFQLKQGDMLAIHANLYTANGTALTDRTVTWISSNSRVVTIAGSGYSAVAQAVGAGTALITAVSEGKVSPALTISVTAVCCQIGEGAPNPIISQAFQDAVTRNRLAIALPAKSTVQRIGSGYTQDLFSSDAVEYLVAKSDKSPTAYVVTGEFLARYNKLGGPSGSLGYPASDGAGHQLFENSSALASSPARLVSGTILAKWTLLGFETSAAGLPIAEAISTVASSGAQAQQQTFAKGVIFAETSGAHAGQAQLVSGLILDRYIALGGPGGAFGLPINDEFGLDNRRHQDFETGYIDYGPADAVATEHGAARKPAVSSTPANTVVAGSRLRLSVAGFADGATLQVSITDQPDFVVTAANGSYIWETYVPLSAPSKTFTIHAVDGSGATADGSYTVKSLAESKLQLVKTQGDAQAGAPGAQLTQKLRVQLQDENGTPVIGVAVTFAASPGGQILSATALTDDTGQAEAAVRLPPSEGLALFTAEAARLVSTFSARAAAYSLTNYPAFSQADAAFGGATLGKGAATIAQKGALLTSAAGIVRYYQNRGDLSGSPLDPGALNQFLQGLCHADADGAQVCDGFLSNPDASEQVVNLWRVGTAIGGGVDVSVESPDTAVVRDLVAQGSPVLLALALTANGVPAGGHYVVANGIGADGSVLIRDPNADFGRASLNDYVTGFVAGGKAWQASLAAAVRLLPRTPSATGFLLAAISQPAASIQQLALDAASVAGPCGQSIDLADTATIAAAALLVSRLRYCDGSQGVYQLSVGEAQAYRATLTDLATGGRRADLSGTAVTAFKATRPAVQLVLAPQDVTLTAGGVLNGATFTPGIAPGGLMAILGSGLAGPAADSAVDVNGVAASTVSQSPFQIMAQVPLDLAPGTYPVRVQSPYGSSQQDVEVRANAPAIFLTPGNLTPARGLVVNQDGSSNAPANPIVRGKALSIYCTGLGAVAGSGDTIAPVTVVLNGSILQPGFAGLTPGFIALYQVNLVVPAMTPPGVDEPLFLRQTGGDSNTVFVAVQ